MNTTKCFSSVLRAVIIRYLTLKQALGRRYSAERDVLRNLDSFLSKTQALDLTVESFTNWCNTQKHLSSGVRRNRMRIIRNLCLYRQRTEPDCYVPDTKLFPANHQPLQPYIFTKDEIVRLIQATSKLWTVSHSPLRSNALRLAVVFLYTTGLRLGELLRLTVSDYDPEEKTLLVRESKFHKSRCLPLSIDTVREINTYLSVRQNLHAPKDKKLIWNGFANSNGYSVGSFRHNIRILFRLADIHRSNGQFPRIHNFRHTFAVHALLRWYQAGIDVQAKLPLLATYMGHISIVSTQHYLHFIEELASAASERFADCCEALVSQRSNSQGGTQ